MRNPVHIASLLLVTASAAFGLSACGSKVLDEEKAQKVIASELEKTAGVTGITVKCPSDQDVKKGATFTCKAIAADKTTADVKVVQKDDEGNVRFSSPILHVGDAESQIGERLGGVKVDCPDLTTPKQGTKVSCDAKAPDGDTATITLTFKDDQGNFSYAVKPN